MARVYATAADLVTYTGQAAPDDATALLVKASRFLDSNVFRLCWYEVDAAGIPANAIVLAAFRDATCAQVAWWGELGDSTGAVGAGWGEVRIGSVILNRSATAVSGGDSPARQFAPEVWDVLQSSDLKPDLFRLTVFS